MLIMFTLVPGAICNRFVCECLTTYHDQNMCSTCIVSVVFFQIMKNGTHESENGRI